MTNIRVSSSWIICTAGFFIIFTIYQHLPSLSIRSRPSDISYNVGVGNARVLDVAVPSPSIICDRKHYRYDFCMINGPTIMSPSNSTFSLIGHAQHTETQKIRPCPRKWDANAMSSTEEINLISASTSEASRHCQVWHNAPAIVFSNSGYTGNFYHALADVFVPLFVTARTMFGLSQAPVLVGARIPPWWLTRYAHLVNEYTVHPIINMDHETRVHCFPSVALGLIAHGDITVNPALMPNSESLHDFHALVHRSYHDKTVLPPALASSTLTTRVDHGNNHRPQLVLLARTGTVSRAIVNQARLVKAAEAVGFKVHVFEPNINIELRRAYKLISGSHALIGVHGAGLTHLFFLRTGAVLIQVVPLGLEWAANVCFGSPAVEIGLEYMEYKISVEESTLSQKFDRDDEVLKDPASFAKKGWNHTTLFLRQQDVRLDLVRFRSYLKLAYDKAKKLMSRANQY